ncbi:MAG: outer membrane lipoprotein-sorting protein [Deltaproteobacteria bacterium]|nr:outer membrane lipoprotein-sorting protein [Deltaproteobacteria bacterium]
MKKSHKIIRIAGILPIMGLLLLPIFSTLSNAGETWNGRRIMEEVLQRHELYPYVFEEQTMILIDSAGNRDVRKVRRFSRVEADGTVKYLLVFDNPAEVRGVALLVIRHRTGRVDSRIYLPAFGREMISTAGNRRGGHFLGTDFSIEDLTVEVLSDFRYIRETDHEIDKIPYFVIAAFPINAEIERSTGYGLRRHFIRQDNFFIVRTDYYDPRIRFVKQRTHHDLKRVDGDMWRNNMILMENHKEQHKSLIKIDRRVFSRDYVPSEIFTS